MELSFASRGAVAVGPGAGVVRCCYCCCSCVSLSFVQSELFLASRLGQVGIRGRPRFGAKIEFRFNSFRRLSRVRQKKGSMRKNEAVA